MMEKREKRWPQTHPDWNHSPATYLHVLCSQEAYLVWLSLGHSMQSEDESGVHLAWLGSWYERVVLSRI